MPKTRMTPKSTAAELTLDGSEEDSAKDLSIDRVDTSYLQTLLGYNARRAALAIIEKFIEGMASYDLRPVDFSILSVIHHNPGVTSRQLSHALGIQPPNLVGLINRLQQRGLISRLPHPHDGRAMGLHLTPSGKVMTKEAEKVTIALEKKSTAQITPAERSQLIRILSKIYS